MRQRWVNLVSGVPTVSNFLTTEGEGSPICIDRLTGCVYYLTAAGAVQQANQTINGPFRVNGSPSRVAQYATVDGTNYSFSETSLGLTNPLATPADTYLFSFGAEGYYTATGAPPITYDFYIYDVVLGVYRCYIDQTGAVNLGGTNAKFTPALVIATNGALTIPEVAAASVPNPSAAHQSLFIDTTDHKLKRKDSAGTVTIIA